MKPAAPASGEEDYEFLFYFFAFVFGFLGSLAGFGWLVMRYLWAEMVWWEIIPTALEMLKVSILGGLLVLGCALGIVHLWRTVTSTHQCIACDQRQRHAGFCAECQRRYDNHTLYRPSDSSSGSAIV